MLPAAIIAKKRDSEPLSASEIRFMIDGLVDGSIADYQIAAWAMAILCRGMNEEETEILTDCMLESGCRLARATERPRVDKHSTGGLGDKISLVLAPLLACAEVDVPMLSGRGLGITGGTLDKLESYPGYRCDLNEQEITAQLQAIGCVITGTTPDIAPADRKLYRLRDVTGTVPSIALITSSIMSKKLAATLDALVLDVKVGSGAFMQDSHDARRLADRLVSTGRRMNVETRAVLTDMNQPLGRMVGNACEANEAVEVLQGGGPADVRALTLQLGAEVLAASGVAKGVSEAKKQLLGYLDSGEAFEKYVGLIEAQGGLFSERLELAEAAPIHATGEGFLSRLNGQLLGQAVIELGGGRRQMGDRLNHRVGVEMHLRLGDRVQHGQQVATLFAASDVAAQQAQRFIHQAMELSTEPPEVPSLLLAD